MSPEVQFLKRWEHIYHANPTLTVGKAADRLALQPDRAYYVAVSDCQRGGKSWDIEGP
jgi:hypothetical protein